MKRKDMLLSLREAADYLRVSYGNIRLIIHRHGLETVTANDLRMDRRRRYISRAELNRYRRRRVAR
jgi:excisionase family DNA binding protein